MTVTKIEGDVDAGQTESIAINCCPEFVGSQEEQVTVLIDGSLSEDRNGKVVTLAVHSSVPSIDFQDLDSMFQENHVLERIQDFDCPKQVAIMAAS